MMKNVLQTEPINFSYLGTNQFGSNWSTKPKQSLPTSLFCFEIMIQLHLFLVVAQLTAFWL